MGLNAGDQLEFEMHNGDKLTFPKSFGSYRYVRTLGHGTFSAVVLCQHKSGTVFAVKVFSRRRLVEHQLFDRFEREVRVLESLRHPFIVRLEEVVFTEELIYVIMEYCERGELYDFVGSFGLMSPQVVARIFKQITEAVCFIHSRNVVHRDLKPENILLTEDMTPRLADFGLCHTTSHNKLLRTPCGSPFYAPPEVLAQLPYDGKASDVWSLGLVLYAMTTGELPWRNENLALLFTEIRDCDVEIPDYLDETIRELLVKMLSRNPADRPTAVEVQASRWCLRAEDLTGDGNQKLPLLLKASTDFRKRPLDAMGRRIFNVRRSDSTDVARALGGRLGSLVRKVPANSPLKIGSLRSTFAPRMLPTMV
jgi:serine/threonine protein kinase